MSRPRSITTTPEYAAIAAHYGQRRARRSGVLLMRHIDEGLWILEQLGAAEPTRRAWCLHPIAQDPPDPELARRQLEESSSDGDVRALALEYRQVANATLSTRPIDSADDIVRSERPEIGQLLVADKVQNRKDFLRHHRASHPRAAELDRYFRLWLEHLGVSEPQFEAWSRELDRRFDEPPA